MRKLLPYLLCAALAFPVPAFIRIRVTENVLARRPDFSNIVFLLNDRTAAGMTNTQGSVSITADSDPVGALQAALDSWTNIPSSAVTFAPLGRTSIDAPANDGQNIMTFADNPTNRSIVGDALVVAVTRLRFFSNGQITDTDMVFSPTLPFSTTLQSGTLDIQAVATHELGHALGASHSGLLGATMYARTSRASNLQAVLTADDIAFATEVYPEAGVAGSLGVISGRVDLGGAGSVAGAMVTAIDPGTSIAIGSFTAADGTYRIAAIPPGRYFVYAEPMDGPVSLDHVRDAVSSADTGFTTVVLGGAATPEAIAVTAGNTSTANLTVTGGTPALNLQQGGSAPLRATIPLTSGPMALRAGQTADIALVGTGLDDPGLTDSSISFFGAPITVQPGSLSRATVGGQPAIRVTVQLAANAPVGLATIMVRSASSLAVYSAGLKILLPAPSFPSTGVVSAASFTSGAAAPGEIVSIFGNGLGPLTGVSGVLDGGRLSTSLAGVSVTFDGVPAPLFYVSQGQINAQVPVETSKSDAVDVVVRYQGIASSPVRIPMATARPAIFVRPGTTQAIAQNQDGTLNEPANPADRGQFVVIYGTGAGLTSPLLGTGQLALTDPLSQTQPVTVTFGGRAGSAPFSGMTPNFVGLWQINAVIPADAPTGPTVPLVIREGSVSTQPNVTLAIR